MTKPTWPKLTKFLSLHYFCCSWQISTVYLTDFYMLVKPILFSITLRAEPWNWNITGTDVAVIAVDPGFADTDLTRHMGMMKSFTRFFVYPLFWPVMKRARTAAQVILHAALDPHLQDSAGDYYVWVIYIRISRLCESSTRFSKIKN